MIYDLATMFKVNHNNVTLEFEIIWTIDGIFHHSHSPTEETSGAGVPRSGDLGRVEVGTQDFFNHLTLLETAREVCRGINLLKSQFCLPKTYLDQENPVNIILPKAAILS